MTDLLDPRVSRLWEVFRGSWVEPAGRVGMEPRVPDQPLDAFAWCLFAQGAASSLDLRRTRWLARDGSTRILHLVLAAALSRGRGSARLEDLVSDLGQWTGWAPPPSWSVGAFADLRERMVGHRATLEAMLRSAAEACGDDPRDLVRRTTRGGSAILAFARYRECEDDLSRRLKAALHEPPLPGFPPPSVVDHDLTPRHPQAPILHPQQAEAVHRALRHRVAVIAGGPGTGKTTVVARILQALADHDPGYSPDGTILCAPTGRAKARLQESIARQFPSEMVPASSTLHALLGARPDGTFRHDASRPLPWGTIVLDEASMVDQLLFAGLLAALHPRSRLLILGDPDQLPSVDAGGLFADLVAHLEGMAPGSRPYVRLTHTWRNAGAIRALGEEVNRGVTDLARSLPIRQPSSIALADSAASANVTWLEGDLGDVLERWWQVHALGGAAASNLAHRLGTSRILCATHHGPAGRERINALGDAHLRQSRGAVGAMAGPWMAERPVLLTRNLAALDLWNGDLGLTALADGQPAVRFPRGESESVHAPGRLEGLEAAWAITIHKSQGSEFDHVLLILPEEDSPLLTRQILYTGLTRARRTLWIWGNRSLWEAAVSRRDERSSPLLDLGPETGS